MRRRILTVLAAWAMVLVLAAPPAWAAEASTDPSLGSPQVQDKSSRKKKRPTKPQSLPQSPGLGQLGYDPTAPLSPEADLKGLIKAPAEPEQASKPNYSVGDSLRLSPGAAPVPEADRPGQAGGGLRASWLTRGGLAVSGGLGYAPDSRTKVFSPSSSGPSENAPAGPAAGVVLKYSF